MLPIINQFVYRPDATFARPGFSPAALGLEYEEVSPETADGLVLSGWYLPAMEPTHALLYCHGNAGDIRDWVHAAPPFVEAGVSVLIFDYRGYGRSQGSPSEEGLYQDGEAVWSWLEKRALKEGVPASILGKSLGSAVACHLAARKQPVSLVLDSAFTSMREVVARNVPWAPPGTIPKLFESLERAPEISCPALVLHGGRDSLVPPEQGRRLFQALNGPKAMREIGPAGHNDISLYPEYQRWILEFLTDPEGFVGG
ncbi:MAG: alpha/beta hydrolase [Candidatus Promineifilaceae bacterium]